VATNSRQLLIIATAVVLVAAAAIYWFVGRPDALLPCGAGGEAQPVATALQGCVLLVPGPLGELGLGVAYAPNVIIEYASMTCPHCQRFHAEVYGPLKEKYVDTGKAYFIFREFPLDPLATAAIMVARCAPPDRYFPLVDLMFEKQREWAFVTDPTAALRNLVRQAGFTQDSFQACLTNQEILDGVNWVKERGQKEFGVNSTPTFFVNGQLLRGDQSLEAFDAALGD
jgi:protein-disulfide isomerase